MASAANRGLAFPWDSVPSDLNTKGWDKAGCPQASFAFDWELWKFSTQDPNLEFVACARTQSDVPNIPTYMATNGAKKLVFLVGGPWHLCLLPTLLGL